MRHYTRPRPTLPDTTPFLADSKFAGISPWHGDSIRSVVPTTTTITTTSTSELLPVTMLSTADDMVLHTARSSQTAGTSSVISVVSSLSSFFDPPKQRVQHRLRSKHKPIPPSLSTNNKFIPPIIALSTSTSSSVASQIPSVSYMINDNGLPRLSRIQPPNVLSLFSPGGTKATARTRLASLHSINESQGMSSASVLEAEMDEFVDIEIERKEVEIVTLKDKVSITITCTSLSHVSIPPSQYHMTRPLICMNA